MSDEASGGAFDLPAGYLDLQREARELATSAAGLADRADEADHVDPEMRELLRRSGLCAVMVPSRYGGRYEAVDSLAVTVVREALAAESAHLDSLFAMQGIGSYALSAAGSAAIRDRWLPAVGKLDAIAALGLTEPEVGSDLKAITTTVRADGDELVVTGRKSFITNAGDADFYTVLAREDRAEGTGYSLVVLPADAPGLSVEHPHQIIAPHVLGDVIMDEVRVPADHRVGEPGRGFAGAMEHFDFSRPALGLLCLGAAQASIDEACTWAVQREAFGRPLAAFQGVSFPLAEHATYMEAARWLCYRSLWAREAGDKHTHFAAMSKWWPPIVAKDAIETAIVTFGNLGYSTEMPLQQRYRDVASYLIADGTAGIQKRIIATAMMGKVAAL